MKYLDQQDLVVSRHSLIIINEKIQYIDYNRESQSFLMHFPGLTFFFNQIGAQVEVSNFIDFLSH
jgi:hypothetical protein